MIAYSGVMESQFVLRSMRRSVGGGEEKFNMAALSSTTSQMKRGPNSGKQGGHGGRERESCWLWVVYGTGRRVGHNRHFQGHLVLGQGLVSFSQLLA